MSQQRRGFVTGGTWCYDRNRKIDAWPREDSVAITWGLEERGGGSACNLAIDMRRLDSSMPVATIGLVGSDRAGEAMIAEADAAGIDRSRLQVTTAAPSAVTEAFISEASGLRTHITELGASSLLSPNHFDFSDSSARFFHLGLPGVHETMDRPWHDDASGWVAVLKKARAAGLRTNLELCTLVPERLRHLIRPCLPFLDTLIVNDSEIGAIAEHQTVCGGHTDIVAVREAAEKVLGMGAMDLIVIHFPEGAVLMSRAGDYMHVPSVAFPADLLAGPNGAGDAFAAGVLYGLHEEWPLEKSLRLGHAVAACSLRTVGTTDGVERWSTCLDLADLWGWRRAAERRPS